MPVEQAREFEQAWQTLDVPFRRCLELAYESLVAGGLAVGSVLTDAAGEIASQGRNRAYDPAGRRDALPGRALGRP
jgi:hypothetical protein